MKPDPAATPARDAQPLPLPLFPLRSVLFPGGLLPLRVFEARYLDMVSRCLREAQPFGVVCLRQGSEVRPGDGDGPTSFEPIGTVAHLEQVDSDQPGILKLRCRGGQRFALEQATQQVDGLWTGWVHLIDDDPGTAPQPSHDAAAQALRRAAASLSAQGESPFLEPCRFDDAAWVANRWCELLPISLSARQQLMALPDPLARLELVAGFLRKHEVID